MRMSASRPPKWTTCRSQTLSSCGRLPLLPMNGYVKSKLHPLFVQPSTAYRLLALLRTLAVSRSIAPARAANWLCLTESPRWELLALPARPGAKLALFVVCTTGHPPKLGLFVQHPLSGWLAQIGFVLHDLPSSRTAALRIGFVSPKSLTCPLDHNSLPIKDLSDIPLRCQLGLFRIFRCPWHGGSRPNWVCLARLVLSGPRDPMDLHPVPGDWLCFARWHLREIGFVCTTVFRPATGYRLPATASWLCLTR
jgi:hypothetical protein